MTNLALHPAIEEFSTARASARQGVADALKQAEWILLVHGEHREQLSHALSDLGARFWDRLSLDPAAVDVLARVLGDIASGIPPRLECYRCGACPEDCNCCRRHRLDEEPAVDCGKCEVRP